MKQETLELFASLYKKNINKIKDAYSEIDALNNEISTDPRQLEIIKSLEEIKKLYKRIDELKSDLNNDPKVIKIRILEDQLYDYEVKHQLNNELTPEEYSYYKTYPECINAKETYGIYLKTGPFIENEEYLPFEDILEDDPNNKKVFYYTNIENQFDQRVIEEQNVDSFETNNKIIELTADKNHHQLQKEFYELLLESMNPETAYDTMAKKYNRKISK